MTSRRGEGVKSETASERVTCSQTQAQNCCQVCDVCVLRVCVLYIYIYECVCVCTAYTDLISRQHAAKPRLSSERDSNALGALTGKGVV